MNGAVALSIGANMFLRGSSMEGWFRKRRCSDARKRGREARWHVQAFGELSPIS
jgi:hypothetical protein